MSEKQKTTNFNREEVTLREMILKVMEYFNELLQFKKLILASSLFLSILLCIYALGKKPVYLADLSFMINEDNGNPLGSISGMLGTFGIETKDKNNLAKVLELSKSRRIIQNSIFNSIILHDSSDLFANHLIQHWDTLGQWNTKKWYQFYKKSDDSLLGFRFTNDAFKDFSPTAKKAFKRIFEKIAGNPEIEDSGILKNYHNPASRIMHLTVQSRDPDLSIALTNILFDELSDFYVEKSIEKQQVTYDILSFKTDSLRFLLEKKENQLASFEDSWMGRYSSKSKLQQQRLNKEIQMLTIALGESIKNKEIADFTLKNTTPFIQIIDRPDNPLTPLKPSFIKYGIIGFFLGMFLGSLAVSLRKLFRDALKEL